MVQKMHNTISTYSHKGLKITISMRDHSLEEVLDAVQCVIKGCGFVFEGTVCIREDEL